MEDAYRARRVARFLHISDIHYGFHAWLAPPQRAADRGQFTQRMIVALVQLLETAKLLPIDGLIVSGDLTQRATQAEFQVAAMEISSLAGALNLLPKQVVVCPGNHDVDWFATKSGVEDAQLSAGFDNYRAFLNSLYGLDVAHRLYGETADRSFVARHEIGEAVFYTVNSSFLEANHESLVTAGATPEAAKAKTHFGYVGQTQLARLSELMIGSRDSEKDLLWRCMVLHHHLIPSPHDVIPDTPGAPPQTWLDQSIARDAGMLIHRMSQDGFRLVLHGHKHVPLRWFVAAGYQEWGRGMYVLGNGSSGVDTSELPRAQGHHARLIELASDGTLGFMELSPFSGAGGGPYMWKPAPFEHLSHGYDEVIALRERFRETPVIEGRALSVLDAVGPAATRRGSWRGRNVSDLMEAVKEVRPLTRAQEDNIFWHLVIGGALEFTNIRNFSRDLDAGAWEDSLDYSRIATRGMHLLEHLRTNWTELVHTPGQPLTNQGGGVADRGKSRNQRPTEAKAPGEGNKLRKPERKGEEKLEEKGATHEARAEVEAIQLDVEGLLPKREFEG